MTDEVLLITRVRTVNKGNQALSAAWLAMTQGAFPEARVRVLERRPRHLLQYTLGQLARSRDPMRELDRIAERLAREAPGPQLAGEVPAQQSILLDESIPTPVRFVSLRKRLNLRGRLAALGRYADEYRRRLSAMQRARLVIVNPAGEFFPREPVAAFYHLLDAHVAQKLGRPTAIVNHTLDITDPTLRKVIPSVYRTLRLVGFRDDKSVAAFRAMGGDMSNVVVVPDLALTIAAPASKPRDRRIAVAVNVPEASAGGYLGQWSRVVEMLRGKGFDVALVSNELPLDIPFYRELAARLPDLEIEGAGMDHDAYCRHLGTFSAVVSSRMHTCILAMIGGAAVVPVEGASFKITGLFQELGIARPVTRPAGDTWPVEVVAQAADACERRDMITSDVSSKLTAVRERITSMLVPRLRDAAANGIARNS